MMRIFLLLSLVLASGCLVRTYTITRPRTDLEVTGNQGYIMGTPKEEPRPNRLGTERKIPVVEIELGRHTMSSPQAEEGMQQAGPVPVSEKAGVAEPSGIEEEIARPLEPESESEIVPLAPQPQYKVYIVQKNDTLQKISQKFYGTTKKWKFLYNVNKDVLKSPDKIYPGQKIKIPVFN